MEARLVVPALASLKVQARNATVTAKAMPRERSESAADAQTFWGHAASAASDEEPPAQTGS